jgi:hypothetical protein
MTEQRTPDDRMPERLTFVLGSGESATVDKATTVRWLKHLFEFYNGEEKDWHDKTYNGERTPGGFNQGYENEWMRYRQEAASLAFAIQVISGEAP